MMANFITSFILIFIAFVGHIDCQFTELHVRNLNLQTIPENIKVCYRGTMFYPSNRLSNSLDNLIYLIEKIEDTLVSKSMPTDAAKVANMILKRFQVNGIKDVQNYDDKSKYQYEINKQDIVWSLLPNSSDYSTYNEFPAESALTDIEKCSLHWMLSTTVNSSYSYDYYSYSYNTDPSLFYPREGGTVYSDKAGTFSAGGALAGIAASPVAYKFTVKDLLDSKELAGVDSGLQTMQIDPILGATIAGEIGQSVILYSYPKDQHAVLGPAGTWNGTNCATTYTLNSNVSTAASDSELAGAIDGFVMGGYLKQRYYQGGLSTAPYLSQVLRSYYGRGLDLNSINVCSRKSSANQYLNQITESATAFGVVYKAKGSMIDEAHAYPLYNSIGADVSTAVSQFQSYYLGGSTQFDCNQEFQSLPCQSQNDIFVVMDVSAVNSNDNFQEQKNFVGTLISRITSFPNASHFGIYTFSSSNREPVPFNYNPYLSGADIRCQLQRYTLYVGTVDAPGTIRFVQDKIRSVKNYQRNNNFAKIPGKVVIFIYLQSSVPNTNDVKIAMNGLKGEFPEVTVLAVGTNRGALQNFASASGDIFVSVGEQLSINVEPIRKRLCTAPASIEYRDCANPVIDSERNLIADTFVYQDTYQWLAVNPWTMNRSTNLIFYFSSLYGDAQICFKRTFEETGVCYDTSSDATSSKSYELGDTCGSSCPPIYLNIKGKTTGGSAQKCWERACDSWNQVKVSVYHEGLKCSACQMLSTLTIVLISILCSLLGKF